MRFAADESATQPESDPSIETVTAPSSVRLETDAEIGVDVANDASVRRDVTVTVDLENHAEYSEQATLEPESETTVDVSVPAAETGRHRLSVDVREAGEDDDVLDEWDETLTVTGRLLTLEWGETFVPAEHAGVSEDTRDLAFACFELRLREGDEVFATYAVDSEPDVEFLAGAYPSQLLEDDRLEEFDGERGRWLGTDEQRTELVLIDHEAVDRADTLELHGYSLLEAETTVEARTDGETTDTAGVPTRGDGESVIEIDLESSVDGS
ncbi:hypothetical protein C446_10525 [Halobiforma nitratireducens JCM 10879]|uniref:CARDB domain-containing protein n=2 Tax=Halobiforma nitratireducens TaxID=130048 RepID=M0LZP7_9EURY|nr:hypothetical protein C446_10525 [Halobiforma nitratireducens JCM 10879]